MTFSFDMAAYVQPPKMDVANAIAMVAKLLRRTPEDAPEGVTAAAAKLRKRAARLQAAWARRAVKAPVTRTRPQVVALIGVWSALQGRLVAWTRLPPGEHPESVRAQELLDALFANGRDFLKLEQAPLWAESARRLDLLDAASRAAEAEALAGEAFVRSVRKAHKACGDALGTTAAKEPAGAAVDLMPLLNEVRDAVAAYALQLLAATDHDDAASVARTAHALAPIDEQRGRAKGRRAVTQEPDAGGEPDAPVDENTPDASSDAQPANDTAASDARVRSKKRRVA